MKKLITLLSLFVSTFYLNAQCVSNFTSNVSGNTASFTNTSTGTNNNTSYFWTFGSSTSYSQNPSFSTTGLSGYINACLTISDSSVVPTCISTFCDSIFVGTSTGCNLQASFTTATTTNNTILFTNTSTNTNSNTTYSWSFGGLTSSMQNPSFSTIGLSGFYNACLTITDSNNLNCSDTYCDSIYISGGSGSGCTIQANFNYSISGNTVSLTNTSTNTTQATTYSWTFGGVTSTMQNPTFNISGLSGYILTCLTVFDSSGSTPCFDTYCDSIYVGSSTGCNLQAYFNYGTTASIIIFADASSNTNPTTLYSWSFNGLTSNIQNPSFTLAGLSGYVMACLTISDSTNSNCFDTFCDSVYVGSGCNLQAYFNHNIQGNSIIFTDASSNTNTNTNYLWSFGNLSSTMQNPTFNTNGITGYVLACLTITDSSNLNCSDTYCDTIYVGNSGCNIQASFTDSILGNVISFTNTSTNTTSNYTAYYWTFGGMTSSLQNPTFNTSGMNGYQTVCLTITDSSGTFVCYDTYCDTININMTNSINNPTNQQLSFNIYPNPAVESLNVEILNTNTSTYIVDVYNVIGKQILTQHVNSQNKTIHVADLPNGLYFIKVYDKNNPQIIKTNKFVKK